MAYAIGTRTGPSHRRRDAPLHVLMIGVMIVTMVLSSAVVSVAGAAVLVVASIVCAALSRSRTHLREHVVDLWAMALVLLIFLPASPSVSSHGHLLVIPHDALFAVILALWITARVWLVRGGASWRSSLASGAVTAVGLAVMVVVCG